MRDFRLRKATAATVALALLATLLSSTSGGTASADGHERYLDPVFEEVEVIEDIHYRTTVDHNGDPIDLSLDLHQPVGDEMDVRPVIVWMHGGGFTGGNESHGRSREMSMEYAKRGFVVAAIQYRVDPTSGGGLEDIFTDPDFFAAILNAFLDARAAVAFLREHADDYDIDPDAVFATGYSAGAVLALMLQSVPDIESPEAATDPSRVQAVASIAGAMLAEFIGIQLVQPGEPPTYMAHGENDTRVPYAAAVQFCEALLAVGNECELFTMPATSHNPTEFHEEIREQASHFFFDQVLAPLGYTTDVAPPPPPTSTTTSSTTTPTRAGIEVDDGLDGEPLATLEPPSTPSIEPGRTGYTRAEPASAITVEPMLTG